VQFFLDTDIHKKVLNRISKSLENNKLAHAYLFFGPEGAGKEAIALQLAKALNCTDNKIRPCNNCPSCHKANHFNHPDIHFIFPILKSWIPKEIDKEIKKRLELKSKNPFIQINNDPRTIIPIDQIRDLKNEAIYASYEGGRKIYIIADADKMSREASNALLKLLEEPPPDLHLILTTSSLNAMLETIRSRCQTIYFPALTYRETEQVAAKFIDLNDETKKLIHLSEGNLKKVFEVSAEDISHKNQLVYEFLKTIASANILGLYEMTEQITKSRDKNYLMDILNLLILWFKDAIMLGSLGPRAKIVNVAYERELQRFAAAYLNSDFIQIINEIEKAVSNLNRNVYAPLVLTVLAIKINENLSRSE
jgi:DNA polymerase-3 subunit delta'